jgi:Fe2+ or Zn2+ uptake regulation protein
MIETYAKQLRARGYRMTPQRLAILRVIQEAHKHLTPQEVCQQAQQAIPGLTEATVYRTLNFLSEQNLVLAAHIGNGQLVYEIAGHDHHHLICRKCDSACEIEHAPLEALYQQLQTETGYLIDSVHTTFFGLCPACQESSSQDRSETHS